MKTSQKQKKRFVDISEVELESLKKKPPSKNTEQAQQWAFNVLCEWIRLKGEADGSEKVYVKEDLWGSNAEKVCKMLSKFVLEARQSNGEPYTPKSVLQLMINLQSFAFLKNPKACHFMNHKDIDFLPLHNTMNNLSKKLLGEGVGARKIQARVITEEEEEELWRKGVMGKHTPISLLNTVFFYCGMLFCLQGGLEHRELKYS